MNGRVTPPLALALAERLPDDSYLAAMAQGGRDHLGWGMDRHILASIFDAVNTNTKATGQWKKGPPKIKPWPRPKSKPKREKKKVTVMDLYRQFGRG